MDGQFSQTSQSLETLLGQNEFSITLVKNKLREIVNTGQDHCENTTSIATLLQNDDIEIKILTCNVIAELAKGEELRLKYCCKDVVNGIIKAIDAPVTIERKDLYKQAYRALGNLCYECDTGRRLIIECDMKSVLEPLSRVEYDNEEFVKICLFFTKFMLNFILGGTETCRKVISEGLMDLLKQFLRQELDSEDFNDDMLKGVISIVTVIVENCTELVLDSEMIKMVLNILRETTNMEISDACLDVLHIQSEHDEIKTLLANEGAPQLLVSHIELLVKHREAGELTADEEDAKALCKRACELLIIILTGDEAMKILYDNGSGETYLSMIRWLDSTDYDLLSTGILAIGNFARMDEYCVKMLQDNVYSKLLDLFETYHGFSIRMASEPNSIHPINITTVTGIQHALLSALRNLVVPSETKRSVAAAGRALPIMMKALPKVEDPNVAYKLMAGIRLLTDGQGPGKIFSVGYPPFKYRQEIPYDEVAKGVARQVCGSGEVLRCAARWGREAESAGAAGEAPRLLAWALKNARDAMHGRRFVETEGCVSCLVNMLTSSHGIMQYESLLSLTLLAMSALMASGDSSQLKQLFKRQLVDSEIGKHLAVLVETSCSKMPVEVAENLLAFLEITLKEFDLADEYVTSGLPAALNKLDSRTDFKEELKKCIAEMNTAMQDTI